MDLDKTIADTVNTLELFVICESQIECLLRQRNGANTYGFVHCSGDERSLALCPFQGFVQENCDHREDAGVVCQ